MNEKSSWLSFLEYYSNLHDLSPIEKDTLLQWLPHEPMSGQEPPSLSNLYTELELRNKHTGIKRMKGIYKKFQKKCVNLNGNKPGKSKILYSFLCNQYLNWKDEYRIKNDLHDIENFLKNFRDIPASISIFMPIYEETTVTPPTKGINEYQIRATALGDIHAIHDILRILSPLGVHFTSKHIRVHNGDNHSKYIDYKSNLNFVIGGSAANRVTNSLIRQTKIEHTVDKEKFYIKYKPLNKEVSIQPSSISYSESDVRGNTSYGVILRINDKTTEPKTSTFVCFGLDERASRRAATWLKAHWRSDLYSLFGSEEFTVILQIQPDNDIAPLKQDIQSAALVPEAWFKDSC